MRVVWTRSSLRAPSENASIVKSAESTEIQIESLREEFKDLKTILQAWTVQESPGEVHGGACCTLASNTNRSAPILPKRPWSQRRST